MNLGKRLVLIVIGLLVAMHAVAFDPFVLKDIPAMWWFTGFHPDYHQVTDTVDRINFSKMVKILKLAYRSTLDFANTATPPKFVAVTK